MLFDPDSGETRAMRSKEDAQDYRYFPDPDLPPLVIAPRWIERVQGRDARSCRGAMAERFVQRRWPSRRTTRHDDCRASRLARFFEAARDATQAATKAGGATG